MVEMKGGGVGGVIGNEVIVYVCFEGYIHEVVNRGGSYVGGKAECVWMWENVGEIAVIG